MEMYKLYFSEKKIFPGYMHCTYIVYNVSAQRGESFGPHLYFWEYKTLIMASRLFYVPMQLQPVQIEVGRKK